MDDIAEVGVLDPVTGQHDHKGAVPVSIDVRRSMTQPVDVIGHNHRACRKWDKNGKAHSARRVIVGTGLASRALSFGKTAELSGQLPGSGNNVRSTHAIDAQ
ncbi:hypothetical protein D3C71_1977620 [compost metagenome]